MNLLEFEYVSGTRCYRASQYFVYGSFGREFGLPVRELESPLQVFIANEHGISTFTVYRGCVLDIFRVSFLIDLISIPMRDVCVIMAIDWLSHFGQGLGFDFRCPGCQRVR